MANMTNKENAYKGFTLGMALMDALPVVFFTLSCIFLGMKVDSLLFRIGSALVAIAGIGKVLWKLLLALKDQDIHILNTQMRILMPLGFVLLIIGVILVHPDWVMVLGAVTMMPSLLFFVLGIIGLFCMGWFAGHMDQTSASNNWREQTVNTLAQACIFLGILFLH
jgi:hypothetical protein